MEKNGKKLKLIGHNCNDETLNLNIYSLSRCLFHFCLKFIVLLKRIGLKCYLLRFRHVGGTQKQKKRQIYCSSTHAEIKNFNL